MSTLTAVDEFDFELPTERIAQRPAEPRDASKLLVCEALGRLGEWNSTDMGGGFSFSHRRFSDLADLLNDGDFLVMNDAKVLPVRLLGARPQGGAVEALLLRRVGELEWSALMHMSAKAKPGLEIVFEPGVVATVLSTHEERVASEGEVRLKFSGLVLERCRDGADAEKKFEGWLEKHGHVPLPPYIERSDAPDDKKTYQTVYARQTGSAAAPTAGFHFTPELLARLDARGVTRSAVTLHIGLGTFRPMKAQHIEEHVMHEERFEISQGFIDELLRARREGRRIVAVGTTVVRALESWSASCAASGVGYGEPKSIGTFSTKAYITPGYRFAIVDDLITNFHLPKSTLLVLVGAAMGLGPMRDAYRAALASEYRFFSYGDAMFIRGRSRS